MSSTIFAICCHILFYSRSASALRIAEVDDYRVVKCAEERHTAADKVYVCKKTCPADSDAETAEVDGGVDNKDACLKTIGDKVTKNDKEHVIKAVQVGAKDETSKKHKCTQYSTFTGKPCATDSEPKEFWAPSGGIFGDPHVVNMAGEKFDILATGTFSLLSLTKATEENLMINGTIARFGTKCGESFITDLEHTGGWLRKAYNTGSLKVRAVQDTPKQQALQINFGQKWEPLSDLQEMAHVSKTADGIQFDFSRVSVQVSAGKHWRHGWNFLNLDVQGLASLDDSIRVGGLLGYDDHTHVLQADADCAMFTKATETGTQSQRRR